MFDIHDILSRPPEPEKCVYEPFITGSYAYGIPGADSDLDLVVLMNADTKNYLSNHADDRTQHPSHYALRMGKLNLICCTSLDQYEAWRVGTLRLISERPVSRDRAIKVLSEERRKRSVEVDLDEFVSDDYRKPRICYSPMKG